MRFRTKAALALLFSVIILSVATVYSTNNRIRDLEEYPSSEQLSSQVYYFKEVLDKFGVYTIDEVVAFWTEAYKTRNGVYQYVVSSDEFKKRLECKWGEAEKSFWNIGGSSPWLIGHEVIYKKRLDSSTYEVKLKLLWETSAGPSEPTYDILTIVKGNDIWKVRDVQNYW